MVEMLAVSSSHDHTAMLMVTYVFLSSTQQVLRNQKYRPTVKNRVSARMFMCITPLGSTNGCHGDLVDIT